MPLVRIPEPFDHPDWVYEVKHDGFRALAYVEGTPAGWCHALAHVREIRIAHRGDRA
jgi:hypothetical protein